jgi:hypothetical protein
MACIVALVAIVQSAGCVSTPSELKMEPHSVAGQLDVPKCRVSIPLSPTEVVQVAKRYGAPNFGSGEGEAEWLDEAQKGDQFRLVSCKGNPFFALVRNNEIIDKLYFIIVD